MSDEVQWFEVPDDRKRKAPRWARRAAVSLRTEPYSFHPS